MNISEYRSFPPHPKAQTSTNHQKLQKPSWIYFTNKDMLFFAFVFDLDGSITIFRVTLCTKPHHTSESHFALFPDTRIYFLSWFLFLSDITIVFVSLLYWNVKNIQSKIIYIVDWINGKFLTLRKIVKRCVCMLISFIKPIDKIIYETKSGYLF